MTARVLVLSRPHPTRLCIRSASSSAVCPVLSVQPIRALVDEKFKIVVRNLHPKEEVTLHSLHQSEDEDYWEAFGHYTSDKNGTVSVTEDASTGGTYTGVEPMGLLWSMRPIPGSRQGLRLRKRDIMSPMVVNISIFSGHMTQGFSEKDALAMVVTERWYLAPGVRRVDVREQGVKGTLFIPPGPGPFPAVLDMWGGGGGLVEYRAALLASHGFVTMALEYLGSHVYPFSKPQKYPFEVLEYMKRTLLKARIDENNHVIWRDAVLPIPTELDTKVDVARIKCPLMIVVGQDDQNWATVESTEHIQQMMERSGNGHLLTVLSYPGAGHLIEPPYTPHVRFSNFTTQGRQKVLSVQPTRALVDEKFKIAVRNLQPRQEVTLHSLHQSEAKDYWEAFGHYTSDENGTVSVTEDASTGGTYTGVEPMGLLWSMRPIPGSRQGLRLTKRDVVSPMVVNISIFSGHMTQGFSEKDAMATVVTERWYLAPGVQRVDVRERGVKGKLFIPPGGPDKMSSDDSGWSG
ncbi:hypothetical protein ACEWY4_001765 [Coilia grayii]|uniref:Acyl-CoA thioesterase n=1 Tax=Coilia grayii TaxID=363190 RepID=A0ABD1KTX5_9TELE